MTGSRDQGVSSQVDNVPKTKHSVHWFRKGLRLHDNPSLRDCLADACTFRCVFFIDPWLAGSKSVGVNKWKYNISLLFFIS